MNYLKYSRHPRLSHSLNTSIRDAFTVEAVSRAEILSWSLFNIWHPRGVPDLDRDTELELNSGNGILRKSCGALKG